jgi:hypothetical protein
MIESKKCLLLFLVTVATAAFVALVLGDFSFTLLFYRRHVLSSYTKYLLFINSNNVNIIHHHQKKSKAFLIADSKEEQDQE